MTLKKFRDYSLALIGFDLNTIGVTTWAVDRRIDDAVLDYDQGRKSREEALTRIIPAPVDSCIFWREEAVRLLPELTNGSADDDDEDEGVEPSADLGPDPEPELHPAPVQ